MKKQSGCSVRLSRVSDGRFTKRSWVNNITDQGAICERLENLGYESEHPIKLYGEKFHLVSDPIPDGDGFAVEGIARRSGDQRRIRVPLFIAVTIRRELAALENQLTA